MGNGRRWDERKGRDGPKWPAPARIRGGEQKIGTKKMQRRTKWPRPLPEKGGGDKKNEAKRRQSPCQNKSGKWKKKVGRTKGQRRT